MSKFKNYGRLFLECGKYSVVNLEQRLFGTNIKYSNEITSNKELCVCVLIHIPNVYFYLKTYRLILKNVIRHQNHCFRLYYKTRQVPFVSWTHFSVHSWVCELHVVYIDKMHVGMYLNMHISINIHMNVGDYKNKYAVKIN